MFYLPIAFLVGKAPLEGYTISPGPFYILNKNTLKRPDQNLGLDW